MSGPEPDNSPHEERLSPIIAEYLEAEQSGKAPDRETLLGAYPNLADELRLFFADHDRMNAVAEPLRPRSSHDGRTLAQQSTLPPRVQNETAEEPMQPTEVFGAAASGSTVTPSLGTRGRQFGDYRLLQEIARGGMGVVYEARQVSLNRVVAVKMILSGQLASKEDVQRFRAEAEAAANLDHPGIVPIFEVGEHEGQHYFSMGYVNGQSLAERLREGPVPSREAAELLKQVSDAVQYAHEHDVIHRDLKPANVLLASGGREPPDNSAESGGPQPGGSRPPLAGMSPRITDFGLAKRLKGDSHLTGTGQVLGTPSYMSPEQAAGATDRIGPASDVYSLGAILYQMLTGRPPFQAETPLDIILQVLDSEPLPPRLLNPNVPRDLEAICMKCLEKDPERRYLSARDLRDELDRYLEGESIQASSINVLDRVTRALRQSRHEEHFRGWGLGLIAIGLVIFLAHAVIFVLERTWDNSLLVYWLPRTVMFAVLFLMLWRFRPHSVLPTNSAERLIWVVWIGYLLAVGVANVALSALENDSRALYAVRSILSGFGFLIMGGHVWGGGYLVGLVFMIAAPIMALYVDFASLAFGILWAAALLSFGLHYWRRGKAARAAGSVKSRNAIVER